MAIVLVVADGFGGKGDLIFILNAAREIEKSLRSGGYQDDIYIISSDTGIAKIFDLTQGNAFILKKIQFKAFKYGVEEHICIGDDKEKGIKAISVNCFHELLANKLKIDYVIEGPVFDPLMTRFLKIPYHVPWLLMPEYSIKGNPESDNLLDAKYTNLKNPQRLQLDIIPTGLDREQKERGVFVNDELRQVFLQKTQGDFSFRQKYWDVLFKRRKFKENFSKEGDFKAYYQKNQLYLDYTQDLDWRENRGNTCKYFLHLLLLTTADSKLNPDVVSIGRHISSKRNALIEMKSHLMEHGFDKVILIDLSGLGVEEIIFDNQKGGERILRLLHIDTVAYEEMLAIQAVSEDLVFVTGDQSRTEAFGKLFCYEELPHKENSNKQFLNQLVSLTENKRVGDLGKLLLREDLSPLPKNKVSRDLFVEMMRDKSLVAEYKKTCAAVFMQQDLSKVMTDKISLLVLENKSEDYLYHSLRMAAVEGNNNLFSSVLKENKVNFLKKDCNGNTLFGYLFIQHAFSMIGKALHYIEADFQDEKFAKSELDKFIDSYIAENCDAISEVMMKFFASSNQISLNETYSRYFTIPSSFLNAYNELKIYQRLIMSIKGNDIRKFTQLIKAFSVNLHSTIEESILDILIDAGKSDFLKVLIDYVFKNSIDLFFIFNPSSVLIKSPWKKLIEKEFFNNEYLSSFFELEYLRDIIKNLISFNQFARMHPEWVALLKLFNQTIRQDSENFTEGWTILCGLLSLLEKDLTEERNRANNNTLNFLKQLFPEPNNAGFSAALRKFILRDDEGELASNIFLIQCFNRHNDDVITMKSRSLSLPGSSDSEPELKKSSASTQSDEDLPNTKTVSETGWSSEDDRVCTRVNVEAPGKTSAKLTGKSNLVSQSLLTQRGVITWEDFTPPSTHSSSGSFSSSSSGSSSSSSVPGVNLKG